MSGKGSNQFTYTREGCVEATKWLKESDKWSELDKESSRDGWTIVALANLLWT